MLRSLRLLALAAAALWVALLTVRADIFDDIAGAFNTIVSIPATVVRAIYHAIKAVFDFFGHLGTILDAAWDWMVNGIEWLGSRAAWLATSLWADLKWLIESWIPYAIGWVGHWAASFAQKIVHELGRFVVGLVNSAVRFLRGLIHTVEKWAKDAFNLVWGEIKKAASWIAHATFYVFTLLAHPDRLVSWILGHLIVPLVKFIITASAPIIRWLIHGIVRLLPELVHTLEDAIAGIL